MIEKLVDTMKEMIKNSLTMLRAENATKAYCDLLDQMGYIDKSDEVEEYYQSIFE